MISLSQRLTFLFLISIFFLSNQQVKITFFLAFSISHCQQTSIIEFFIFLLQLSTIVVKRRNLITIKIKMSFFLWNFNKIVNETIMLLLLWIFFILVFHSIAINDPPNLEVLFSTNYCYYHCSYFHLEGGKNMSEGKN